MADKKTKVKYTDSVQVKCNNEECEMTTYKTSNSGTVKCINCESRDIEILDTGLTIESELRLWEDDQDED
jgi:hypothetical protein